MMQAVQIFLDCTDAQRRMKELSARLESLPECASQAALELILGYLERLGSDVVVRKHAAATGADAAGSTTLDVRLGLEFERLLAALGALDSDAARLA